MSDCKKHKKNVEKYEGNLKELAKDIGDLHYEALEDFLIELAVNLNEDADVDRERGRKKLSKSLGKASLKVSMAALDIRKAWHISKPFMK